MNNFDLSKKIQIILSSKQKNSKRFVLIMIVLFIALLLINFILFHFSPFPISFSIINIILGVFAGVFVFFANHIITYFLTLLVKKNNKSPISILHIDYIFSSSTHRLLIIVLLASIEEFIFRSYLLSCSNIFFTRFFSIAINAILFYLIHFNKKVIELMFMAIVFSVVTLYSNDLLPVLIAHSLNNIFAYMYKKNKARSV